MSFMPQIHIQETMLFGGGSVMAWGCVLRDCKLDLVTDDQCEGNRIWLGYQRDIMETVVVPHFDNHALATRPVFMNNNARPHRTRALMDSLQRNAITTIPWPV